MVCIAQKMTGFSIGFVLLFSPWENRFDIQDLDLELHGDANLARRFLVGRSWDDHGKIHCHDLDIVTVYDIYIYTHMYMYYCMYVSRYVCYVMLCYVM